LAHNNNIKLIILVENSDGVTCIGNLGNWRNESRWKSYYIAKKKAERIGGKIPKPPVKTETLQKTMRTMEKKYGVRFEFCDPREAGRKVLELLAEGGADG
jgi:ribosome-associated protein